jgi:hypothetical protein
MMCDCIRNGPVARRLGLGISLDIDSHGVLKMIHDLSQFNQMLVNEAKMCAFPASSAAMTVSTSRHKPVSSATLSERPSCMSHARHIV